MAARILRASAASSNRAPSLAMVAGFYKFMSFYDKICFPRQTSI